MADRVVDEIGGTVPEIPEVLSKILQYVVLEAREDMLKEGSFDPYTAVAVKENLFLEEVEGDEPEQMYAWAQHTVEHVKGADGYAFCYDGYIDSSEGPKDAIIAEGGVPGEPDGAAVALIYTGEGTEAVFDEQIVYIGKAPNFMALLDPDDKYVPPAEDDGVMLGETVGQSDEPSN